jgi:cardiolipin synthase C
MSWSRGIIAALGLMLAMVSVRAADEPAVRPPSPFDELMEAPGTGDARRPELGNRLAILSGGYDALLLRVHLIRAAQKSVSIQTFIWANDECGRLLIYELIEAARRGVKVRILADHMFSEQSVKATAFLATVHPSR